MSKVINFNARDFEFDSNSEKNVGFRGFVSTANGNEEIWEIGDWGWNWTQIIGVFRDLTPDTDYVFRFAMTLGHNDDNKEESLVNIFPFYPDEDPLDTRAADDPERISEEQMRRKAWNDRFTFCTKMSRFKPVISKRDPEQDTMIRVFELPFRTDSHTDWKVMFVSQHAVTRLFRAKENEAYEGLEDLSYEQWREQRTKTLEAEKTEKIRKFIPDFPEGLSIGKNFPGPDFSKLPESILQGISNGTIHFGDSSKGGVFTGVLPSDGNSEARGYLDLCGSHITSRSQFERLVQLAKRGLHVNLSGAFLDFDQEDEDDEDEDDEE